MSNTSRYTGATKRQIKVDGIKDADLAALNGAVVELSIDSDIDQPDMATIVLHNQSRQKSQRWSEKLELGKEITISLNFETRKDEQLFKGYIATIEPSYNMETSDEAVPSRLVVRAFDPLHKLSRERKTVAFANITDADMVKKIAEDNKLTAEFGKEKPDTVKHPHVYQHNQTDLKFLRMRAARLGFRVHLNLKDNKLHFAKKESPEPIKLHAVSKLRADATLLRFSARMSLANQVKEVKVRAYHPEKRKLIEGKAPKQELSSLFENKNEVRIGASMVETKHVETDVPLGRSAESDSIAQAEADALAEAILRERMLSFITADGRCLGTPELYAGAIADISCQDSRFDGLYLITAVRHSYTPAGGFRSDFKCCRDAMTDPGNNARSDDSDGQTG